MAYWPSEDTYSDADPECNYFNFSVVYSSTLCTHFVMSRTSSTPAQAYQRALTCAGKHKTECVLSPEIGLAVPAAFLVRSTGDIKMILAPRLLDHPDAPNVTVQHVRVHQPSTRGLGYTRTLKFNTSIHTEYVDGKTRGIKREIVHGADAYCVQLLRLAFVPACWMNLD